MRTRSCGRRSRRPLRKHSSTGLSSRDPVCSLSPPLPLPVCLFFFCVPVLTPRSGVESGRLGRAEEEGAEGVPYHAAAGQAVYRSLCFFICSRTNLVAFLDASPRHLRDGVEAGRLPQGELPDSGHISTRSCTCTRLCLKQCCSNLCWLPPCKTASNMRSSFETSKPYSFLSVSLSLYLSERVSQHIFSAHTHNFSQSSQEIEKLRPIVPKVDPTPAPVYQHFSFLSLYPSSLSLLISYTFTAA